MANQGSNQKQALNDSYWHYFLKLEYDFKEKEWVRKSMTWNCDHRGVDIDSKYQFNNKPTLPSSKQLEREFQLMKILD